MTSRPFFSLLGALLMLAGCADNHDHDHPHDEQGAHPHAAGAGHGAGHDDHGHDHGDASEVVTLWGEHTQLFVEFPALVVGEASPFAAHLTRLSDHAAMGSGTVVVELSGGDAPLERFTVEQPSQAGIFRPIVKPAHPGRRRVTLALTSEALHETHDLGEFVVFSSRNGANLAASEEPAAQGQISYLLEQQWRVPFGVARARVRPLRPNLPAFATLVQPPDAEAVVSAPRAGRVLAPGGRFPRVGESVDQGALLFQLTTAPGEGGDPATLDLAVDQAQIRVDAARREVERLGPLVSQGVVAPRRLDQAQSALETAEAEFKSARRRRNSLSQTQRVGGRGDALAVPAPLEGALAELFVSPGTWVSEGMPLARVVDRERLVLSVGVPEAYVGRLREVSGAWFQLDNVPDVIEVPRSALIAIGTELDEESRTLPVRFRIDNGSRELFAGMKTRAHLIVEEPREAIAVPLTAVVDDSGTDVVFVQTGGETFERRAVRLGIRDGNDVEIVEGVHPGEWVVAVGAYAVKLASTSTESIGHGHAH
ncbi:efflux RND transporter periplasmic adaptor subunit [Lujinxingia litoralis]|uniref:Efflux RND transporter periplasmic adaptor subunit n=1 Tax=Lujinxingia litoralis TaxID=2211119 RepID=A0A328C547_9DELT|nr:efflux RND transporter periplasmic adaptor subunit [Lujinxingia litoralis]RAL21010.1 efflux RND transporter periplasmic adaptor subunit [Lujinxingia litoralis]